MRWSTKNICFPSLRKMLWPKEDTIRTECWGPPRASVSPAAGPGKPEARPWQPMTSRVGATKGPPRGRHQHTEMIPWGSSIAFYLGPPRGQLWTAISSTRGPDKTLDVTFQNLLKFSHANRGLEAHLVHIVGSEDLLKTWEGIVQSFNIKWWRYLEKDR